MRAVQFYGADLSVFQFDFDQSWAAFMLNDDGTVYGRYGSRSTNGTYDSNVDGLKKALTAALAIHADYPKNRASLEGKKGPKPPVACADDFAVLRGRFTTTAVNRNCMHCHNATEGWRGDVRLKKKPLTDELLFRYPMPDLLGLHLDLSEMATVKTVDDATAAAKAGFKAGDKIRKMDGQPLISVADVVWVLQFAKTPGTVKCDVERADGSNATLSLALEAGWRRYDFTWRPSTPSLLPGFNVDDLTAGERTTQGIDAKALALRVRNVNQRGPAAGSGLAVGDVIVSIDDRKDLANKIDFLAYISQKRVSGDTIELTVTGKKKRKVEVKLP